MSPNRDDITTKIDILAGGTWAVVTLSGSVYNIDLNRHTVKRRPLVEDPDEDHTLRRDGEEMRFHLISDINIGDSILFSLELRDDGVPTRRTTSVVTHIARTRLEASRDGDSSGSYLRPTPAGEEVVVYVVQPVR